MRRHAAQQRHDELLADHLRLLVAQRGNLASDLALLLVRGQRHVGTDGRQVAVLAAEDEPDGRQQLLLAQPLDDAILLGDALGVDAAVDGLTGLRKQGSSWLKLM